MPEEACAAPSYEATLDWLFQLEAKRGMDFKLERVLRALQQLGNPQAAFRAIHVGGTNGKGSVAAMIESILRCAGRRTGLYTSPHLVDFRERVRIGGTWIQAERVVDLVDTIRNVAAPEAFGLTFFEVSTILAFLHFAREHVDVAIVEVGLGGRLDATNVLDADVAVLTSVGFDHEAFLGNSLESIATEKAGIFKRNRPAIVGALPTEAAAVVRAAARRCGTPLSRLGYEFSVSGETHVVYTSATRRLDGLRIGLPGEHQVTNAALAIAAVDAFAAGDPVAERDLRAGLERVQWPGRLDVVSHSPWVMLDAAHNPDGARTLAAALPKLCGKRPVHLVFAAMDDKRWDEMAAHLIPVITRVTVTAVSLPRAAAPIELAKCFADDKPTDICEDPREAVRSAMEAAGESGAVVVAGSIFLLGAVYGIFRSTVAPPWGAG